MDRRNNRMLKAKKDGKASKKNKKSIKPETVDFIADFKKQKSSIHIKGVQKITTSRLTVRTKTLNNAVRSVFAVKEQVSSYEEDSKALINQDLFKIIDLSNEPKQKTTEPSFAPIGEVVTNKSIFREIDDKYKQLTPNLKREDSCYLISDENLQKLVSRKISENNNLILNPWAKSFQNFLHHTRSDNFSDLILTRIVANQNKINQTCALFELKNKFRGVPLAGTCLRRKFVRRCNNLTNLQNLAGNIIMSSEAEDIINQINLEPVLSQQISVSVPRPRTPENSVANTANFPQVSFKTPEHQKFSQLCKITSTVTKFIPAIKSKTAHEYIELDREKCTDQKFLREYGITKEEQKFFLTEAVKVEQNPVDLDSILERPKKLQTIAKRSTRFSFEESSPKSVLEGASPPILNPNRKLDFSFNASDDEFQNFDFCLLDDVGKQNVSPIKFGGLFTQNGARKERNTPKRGLESILSPDEVNLRKQFEDGNEENVFTRAKRFAAAPEDLGPMPTARDTPQFKYQRRY